jgi:hypothetical protein
LKKFIGLSKGCAKSEMHPFQIFGHFRLSLGLQAKGPVLKAESELDHEGEKRPVALERKDLQKAPYNIFRTRIEIPGCPYYWHVNTIDVKKLHEQFQKNMKESSLWKEAFEEGLDQHCFFETVVYRSSPEDDKESEENISSKGVLRFLEENSPKGNKDLLALELVPDCFSGEIQEEDGENRIFLHRSYKTFEEAQFGHEELVQSILSCRFFVRQDDDLSDYLLIPDSGEEMTPKDPYFFNQMMLDPDEDPDLDNENS